MYRRSPNPAFLAAVLVALVLAAGCDESAEQRGSSIVKEAPTTNSPAKAGGEVVDFDVEDMTCASCELSIKVALKRIDGVKEVSADADEGSARAVFDPRKTNGSALADAISRLGYPATVRSSQSGGR